MANQPLLPQYKHTEREYYSDVGYQAGDSLSNANSKNLNPLGFIWVCRAL